ncbi:MAG: hypothetical protein H0V00_12525, partial [Chloroflexia bacterium]|nr:hypothetical protein [Chloroflexia bacterium]
MRELPGALYILDNYAKHPINEGFAGTRATLWFQPRALIAERGTTPLVQASADSWGETNLDSPPPVKDAKDIAGPVTLAALGKSNRVLVTST